MLLQVSFHDVQHMAALGGGVPTVSDYHNSTMGSLGEAGVLLACPPAKDTASMIQYRQAAVPLSVLCCCCGGGSLTLYIRSPQIQLTLCPLISMLLLVQVDN